VRVCPVNGPGRGNGVGDVLRYVRRHSLILKVHYRGVLRGGQLLVELLAGLRGADGGLDERDAVPSREQSCPLQVLIRVGSLPVRRDYPGFLVQ
jgi:hypothetical protein